MRCSTILAALGAAGLAAAQTTVTSDTLVPVSTIVVSSPTSTSSAPPIAPPPPPNEPLQSCLASCMLQFPSPPLTASVPPAPAAAARGHSHRRDFEGDALIGRDNIPRHPHKPPPPLVTFPPFPPPRAPIPIQEPRPVPPPAHSLPPLPQVHVPSPEEWKRDHQEGKSERRNEYKRSHEGLPHFVPPLEAVVTVTPSPTSTSTATTTTVSSPSSTSNVVTSTSTHTASPSSVPSAAAGKVPLQGPAVGLGVFAAVGMALL